MQQQQYTIQDIGCMLIAVGTGLAAIAIIWGLAYLIYLAIPVKVKPVPADLKTHRPATPPPVFLAGQMAPQRVNYQPRHERPLPVPQDPWMSTAHTEVR